MKKYFGLLVLGIALFLPMNASAATKVNFNCDDKCVDTGDKCQKTCTLNLSGDSINITAFNATLKLSEGVTLADTKVAEGWDNSLSNGNNLAFTANPAKTGTSIDIATFVFDVSKDGDCTIVLEPTGYENVEVDVTVEQTVETGASLPLAIIACAGVAAGVIYFVSRKNTKMYKI